MFGNKHQVLQILVVDSDAHSANQSVGTISQNGHIVDYAATGVEAIDAVQRVPYDLILLELQLPDQDGFRVAHTIRQLPSHRANVPIMALSIHQTTESIRRAYAAGMCNMIAKPLNTDKLLAALSLLEFRQLQKRKITDER